MSGDERGAIVRRREQVAALQRPAQLSTGRDIRAEVAEAATPGGLWRVYMWEWVAVYTSDVAGDDGYTECWDYYGSAYEGRLRLDGYRVSDPVPGTLCVLEINRPNLCGEYKIRERAEDHGDELASQFAGEHGVHVVARNSPQERALLDYGIKKLRDG